MATIRSWFDFDRRLLCFVILLQSWLMPCIAYADEKTLPAAGHLIAVGGGPGGAGTACFSCHGLAGQGDAGAAFPHLAGLNVHYLAKQMEDYASGARTNAVMTPIALQLDADERQAVAAYYASLPAIAPANAILEIADSKLMQWGAILYAQGSAERRIQGCTNCHGPVGQGVNRVYPALAGQPAAYIDAQIRLWRDKTRRNDIHDLMGNIARRMSDEDIQAVSAYLAALSP